MGRVEVDESGVTRIVRTVRREDSSRSPPRKRVRRRRDVISRFLDVEAEVDEDEEDGSHDQEEDDNGAYAQPLILSDSADLRGGRVYQRLPR